MAFSARQFITLVIAAGGIWYMIPSLHQKYNIESHYGTTISDHTARMIGAGAIILALILNAQPQYTLYRIKATDFLSPQRARELKSLENFCALTDRMPAPRMRGSDLDF